MHTWPLSSYTDFGAHFADMRRARSFLENLPFWQMRPRNNLLTFGTGYVFADAGQTYALYLPNGGAFELDLTDASGTLQVSWFNPVTGAYSGQTTTTGGGYYSPTPPFSGDAVLLVEAD